MTIGQRQIVIVGYGMAGSRLASELRARDKSATLKITVLGAEPHAAYNRILLSNLLAGKSTEDDLALVRHPDRMLDVRLGTQAEFIDRARRVVITTAGEEIDYDALVLATGSRPAVPPIPGLHTTDGALASRVAVFRTLDDCRRILATAARSQSALILGGGLLGLEAARGLAGRGLRVEVIHPNGHLMERQLDPAAGAVLARTLSGLGITAHLDATATAAVVTERDVTLGLADGRRLTADLLVLACGVRAETTLAARAGLAVGRAISVDDQLRTDDSRIWAVGDCAEFPNAATGLVATAWDQVRVAADVITGTDPTTRYRPAPPVTRLKAAGIDLAAMGAVTDGHAEAVTFADPTAGLYAKLVVQEERLAGAIMIGDHPAIGTIIQHFDRQTPLPADRRALLLGRTLSGIPGAGAPAADSPALMPDSAVVCRCNNVTKRAICRAWLDGERDLAAATMATTGCGSCRDAVTGITEWLGAQSTESGPQRNGVEEMAVSA